MPHRNAGATRNAIREAALDLFLRHGYDATTLEQIAGRLGLTRPAILYHFRSKEDLLHSVVDPAFDDMEAALTGLENAAPGRPPGAGEVLTALVTAALCHRDAMALVLRFTNESDAAEIGRRATQLNARWVRLLTPPDCTDPHRTLKVVAALSAVGGLMGARVHVPIDTREQVDTVVRGLVALLES
jgi:AcrR family transcriptional regulator